MKKLVKSLFKRMPAARALANRLGLAPEKVDRRSFLLKMLPTGSVGAEIGVHKGDFSARLLSIVKPAKLHLIDPWKHEPSEEYKFAAYGGRVRGGQAEMDKRYQRVLTRFRRSIQAGQLAVHRGCSSDVGNDFPDDYFDWVYIDGNHSYEFVKKDLELCYRKVKHGGYITGDDYSARGWWETGVIRAVDEFVKSNPVELVEIRNAQFILRKCGEKRRRS